MKIIDVKTFVVNAYRTNFIFVKLYTDEGVTGVGEGTLEYKEHALLGAIEDLRPYLLGQDPRQIEKHVFHMYRDSYWRTGPVLMSAISAVEMAMWDISGKCYGAPVCALMGGPVRQWMVCRGQKAGGVCSKGPPCGRKRNPGPEMGSLWVCLSDDGAAAVCGEHRLRGRRP